MIFLTFVVNEPSWMARYYSLNDLFKLFADNRNRLGKFLKDPMMAWSMA